MRTPPPEMTCGFLINTVQSASQLYKICFIIFLLFEFKSVDDVGAGKLREMLTLHINPNAVHGRFTLKDDCERQVWNAVAAS